jgi:beta-fructofuranosidase
VVETFVQGGRLAITSRVYPTVALGSKSGLFLFNNGTTNIHVKSLDVYQMKSADKVFL